MIFDVPTFDEKARTSDTVSALHDGFGSAELSELAHLIADNKVPVIFQDNLANPQAITSLKEAVHALGWQVEISNEQLYADSLGSEPEVDSYLEVFLHLCRSEERRVGKECRSRWSPYH